MGTPSGGDIFRNVTHSMADAFSKIYIHIVFAVRSRERLLQKPWRDNVFKYMTGIVEGKGQKPIIINGVVDHVHLLIDLKPSISVSELVRDVKNNSSKFVNENKWTPGKFQWQDGYGAFSISPSLLTKTYNYILTQEEHHHHTKFQDEYISWMKENGIEANPKYLFDWNEDNV